LNKKVTIATAESCTGGLLSELITSVPGASKVFEIGVCTYSNKIKHEYLGVPKEYFRDYGAVSSQVAIAMVDGLQKKSGADICISVTGTAGPGGGTREKPVGTVYVGISCGKKQIVKLLRLWELKDRSRDNIRMNAAYQIFKFLEHMLYVMPETLPDKAASAKKEKKTYKDVLKGLVPWKGDTPAQVIRKIIFLISVVIFTVCLFMIIDYYWENYKNRQLGNDIRNKYEQAELYNSSAAATEPDDIGDNNIQVQKNWELKEGAKMLLERNKDVVGYIRIPDTEISYPIVQRRQEEDGNEYYLKKNIDNEDANAGTIFLDWRNYFDYVVEGTRVLDNSQNLIVYGHEMKDGSMFGELKNYKEIDGFYSEHPIVELSSNYENYKYGKEYMVYNILNILYKLEMSKKVMWKPGTFLYPLPAVMVSCGTMEKSNIITVAWTGIINTNPAMVYISVRPTRYSYNMIKEQGEFVINLTNQKLARATDWCGVKTGAKVDKFKEMNLHKQKANFVKCPMIEESPVSVECKVKEIRELGSHHMFVAEVLAINADEKYINEKGAFDISKCDLIAYSNGHYYSLGKKIGRFGFSVQKKKNKRK